MNDEAAAAAIGGFWALPLSKRALHCFASFSPGEPFSLCDSVSAGMQIVLKDAMFPI